MQPALVLPVAWAPPEITHKLAHIPCTLCDPFAVSRRTPHAFTLVSTLFYGPVRLPAWKMKWMCRGCAPRCQVPCAVIILPTRPSSAFAGAVESRRGWEKEAPLRSSSADASSSLLHFANARAPKTMEAQKQQRRSKKPTKNIPQAKCCLRSATAAMHAPNFWTRFRLLNRNVYAWCACQSAAGVMVESYASWRAGAEVYTCEFCCFLASRASLALHAHIWAPSAQGDEKKGNDINT